MATNSKEKQKEYSATWRRKNREKENLRSVEYRKRHADKAAFRVKRWQQNNKARTWERIKERLDTDINFKLVTYLRSRLYSAIKRNKSGSAVKDLGCSVQHLKLHIELFWDEGMNWDNWGKGEGKWSIDHIIPLASPSYNLSSREDFLKLNHYTNLQPLWDTQNIRKSNKENFPC